MWRVPQTAFDKSGGQITVTCGTAPYVCGGGDAEAEARTDGRGAGGEPLYDSFAGHFKPGSNAKKYPYAPQSDEYSYANVSAPLPLPAPSSSPFIPRRVMRDASTCPPLTVRAGHQGATGGSIQMFSGEQLPIKKAITDSFGVFNKLYCATPTSSTPSAPDPDLHTHTHTHRSSAQPHNT